MPPRLIVRRERLPERCDICHQTDLFNPVNGYCQRCNAFTAVYFRPQLQVIPKQEPSALSVIAMFLGLISIVPGLCLGPLGLSAGIAGLIASRIEYRRISTDISPKSGQTLVQIGFWSSLFAVTIWAIVVLSLLINALFL